jgi:hypothetical protein
MRTNFRLKPESARPLGNHSLTLEDNTKQILKYRVQVWTGFNWLRIDPNGRGGIVVNTIMSLQIPEEKGNSLTS